MRWRAVACSRRMWIRSSMKEGDEHCNSNLCLLAVLITAICSDTTADQVRLVQFSVQLSLRYQFLKIRANIFIYKLLLYRKISNMYNMIQKNSCFTYERLTEKTARSWPKTLKSTVLRTYHFSLSNAPVM